jgi:WD40 repeat protein
LKFFIIQIIELYSGSLDNSIVQTDILTGQCIRRIPAAHPSAINKVEILSQAENSQEIVSADDDGKICLWDLRLASCAEGKPVNEFQDHIDYISDLLVVSHKKLLISTSGDGYMNIYDFRKKALKASSDPKETELLNMATIKDSAYVTVGLLDGAIDIYAFNYWATPVDRLIGHPSSIEAMLPLTTTEAPPGAILTGGGDGIIRLVSAMPNKFIGVVANMNIQGKGFSYIEDPEKELPISCLALSYNQKWLAASSHHENFVYFWCDHLKLFNKEKEMAKDPAELDIEGDSSEADTHPKKMKSKKSRKGKKAVFTEQKNLTSSSFFSGID